MAAVQTHPDQTHAKQNGSSTKRPRGILKNSYQKSPPVSPLLDETKDLSEKELTIVNTQANAGHRRSSSVASRPTGASRRQSSRRASTDVDPDADDLNNMRLKWDEANLYLTEQERTSTMKITEPKTPYAKHYDPSEDDDEVNMSDVKEDIPGLSLGEPEEEVPEEKGFATGRKVSKVHVRDEADTLAHDGDIDALRGMTPEEREKHRKFEELRKKHYEMSEAVGLLGHPEIVDEDDDEDDKEGVKAEQ